MSTKRIRELNDAFRITGRGGRFVMTPGIAEMSDEMRQRIVQAVCTFNDFGRGNDPHHEHDFGSITVDGQKIFWKIDYYDNDLTYGSEDPTDPAVTQRVLTILLAEEY